MWARFQRVRLHVELLRRVHSVQTRSFARKVTLQKLKKSLGVGVKRRSASGRKGMKGRAPGWLEQASGFKGPRIAIVGRTNVGKSTLFNRLAGRMVAITDGTPGVTRDRKEAQGSLVDLQFIMVDTPGIEELPQQVLHERRINLDSREQVLRGMVEQAENAIEWADVIFFLYDAKVGITAEDRFLAHWLAEKIARLNSHSQSQSQSQSDNGAVDNRYYAVAVANKCETHMECGPIIAEGFDLGLGEVVCLSSETGEGLVDLFHTLDAIFEKIDIWRDTTVNANYSNKFMMAMDNELGDDIDPFEAEKAAIAQRNESNDRSLSYVPISSFMDIQSSHNGSDDTNASPIDTAARPFWEEKKESSHPMTVSTETEGDSYFSYNPEPIRLTDEKSIFGTDESGSIDESGMESFFMDPNNIDAIITDQNQNNDRKKERRSVKDESNVISDTERLQFERLVKAEIDNIAPSEMSNDVVIINGDNDVSTAKKSESEFELKLCIVGRPNVGKSSLINAILTENRCLVADTPGITRDTIAVPLYHESTQTNFRIIDTAGLLGLTRGAYERKDEATRLNILTMRECLRSVRYSNIVAVVIDINEKVLDTVHSIDLGGNRLLHRSAERKKMLRMGVAADNLNAHLTNLDDFMESSELMGDEASYMDRIHSSATFAARQIVQSLIDDTDRQMIDYVISQGRGCVLVLNKWDKMTSRHRAVLRLLKHSLPLVFRETGGLPIVITSAKYNRGIETFMATVSDVYNKWNERVPTPILNRFMFELQKTFPPPRIKQIRNHGRWKRYIRPKVKYLTQYTVRPPSFIGFCGSQLISDYYFYKMRRFLRSEFGFVGVPIRIKLRSNVDTLVSGHTSAKHAIAKTVIASLPSNARGIRKTEFSQSSNLKPKTKPKPAHNQNETDSVFDSSDGTDIDDDTFETENIRRKDMPLVKKLRINSGKGGKMTNTDWAAVRIHNAKKKNRSEDSNAPHNRRRKPL